MSQLTATIGIAVSAYERDRIIAATRAAGTSRSMWMRAVLLDALDHPAAPTVADTGPLIHGLAVHVTPSERERVITRAASQSPAAWGRAQLVAHLHHCTH